VVLASRALEPASSIAAQLVVIVSVEAFPLGPVLSAEGALIEPALGAKMSSEAC